MNHCFACRKDAEGKPACKQWCGRSDLCLSTLTYHEEYMQTAYEHGQRDGLELAAKECEKLTQNSSPQRRVAGEDMARSIRKLWPRGEVRSIAVKREPERDACTDPNNCPRCKAATYDQLRHEHAGIPMGQQREPEGSQR